MIDILAPTPQMLAEPMSDEQNFCKNFIVHTPRCGIFAPMGLGKTRLTLEALYELNPNGHVLIIAPTTIARSVWQDEINKWGMPFRTCSLIRNKRGKKLNRKKRHELYDRLPDMEPSICFINRELVVDLIEHCPMRYGDKIWPFPFVIIDELQSFKNYTAARFKAMSKVLPCISRFVGLTGTPTPKGLMDLWAEMFLIDGGQRLGKNITAYRETFFRPGRIYVNNYPVTWELLPGAEDEIFRRIKDVAISIRNSSLKLPPLTVQTMSGHLTSEEAAAYRAFMKDAVLTIQPEPTDDDTSANSQAPTDGDEDTAAPIVIEAVNAAVLTAKLSQMASGAIYTDAAKHEYVVIHEQKLELCDYIIRNTADPCLVAYHFQSDRSMLMQYLHAAGHDVRVFDGSPEMTREWNAGNIPVMLIQPASAGHGINIQHGGHTLIWYTIPWSLEEYLQTNARLYRQGQKNPVEIYHLVMAHTIDEKILRVIRAKTSDLQKLLDAVDVTSQLPVISQQELTATIDETIQDALNAIQ